MNISLTRDQFLAYAKEGYNRVPLVSESFADLDTPLSLYLKLANQPHTFLLESVVGGERFGRYSFIGLPSDEHIIVKERHSQYLKNQLVIDQDDQDPLAFIAKHMARFKTPPLDHLPRFCGGLAGYFGYDTVRLFEPSLQTGRKTSSSDIPDVFLMLTEKLAVIDNVRGKISLMVYADPQRPSAYEQALNTLKTLHQQLRAATKTPEQKPQAIGPTHREFERTAFLQAVKKAREYIHAGDVMQVVIGQRIQKTLNTDALSVYRALRSLNPSPYLFYYQFGDFQVVGSSPEILVRQDNHQDGSATLTLRPIAGTRPRGTTPEQDIAHEQALLADPKEISEHVMLIDLARNDIGRMAETGSVKVTEQFAIERYSHVMHIVSNVEGKRLPGLSAMDVLKACFPAGTLSGAPKIRAMQIIDELEPSPRGIYGGACGYWSFSGAMDLAIAIRTGVIHKGVMTVQAGAGIVADSDPEAEWQETENKARAVLLAAEQAERGL